MAKLHYVKCQHCNQPFGAVSSKAKYCSQTCRTAAYRRRKKEALAPTPQHRAALMHVYNCYPDVYSCAYGLVDELGLVAWCKVVGAMLVLKGYDTYKFEAIFAEGKMI